MPLEQWSLVSVCWLENVLFCYRERKEKGEGSWNNNEGGRTEKPAYLCSTDMERCLTFGWLDLEIADLEGGRQ